MIDKGKKQVEKLIDDLMFVGLIVIIPMFSVLLTSFILFSVIKNGNSVMELLQTWIVMGVSFVALPCFITFKKYRFNAGDLGIVKMHPHELLVGGFLLFFLYFFLLGKMDVNTLILLSLQTVAVAVCEEIWARGLLFYVIGKLTDNHIVTILFSSIIFTFLIHINRGFFNNLIYRLPGAILMCIVYYRSKKLQYSIMFHFMYNMIFSI